MSGAMMISAGVFETDILRDMGCNPEMHKQFMIHFMEGKFQGSFATGELYEYNPVTGGCEKQRNACVYVRSGAGVK